MSEKYVTTCPKCGVLLEHTVPEPHVIFWAPAAAVMFSRGGFRNWLDQCRIDFAGPLELRLARLDFLFPEVEGVKDKASLSPRALNFLGDLLDDVIGSGFQLTQVGTSERPTDKVEFGGEDGETRG